MFSTKGIIGWVLLGAIILVMALFGVDQGNVGTGSGGYAAIVNGKVVSLLELQNRYQNESRAKSKQWKSLPAAQRQKEGEKLRVDVLNRLVNTELASQSAEKIGLTVSDKEVMDQIVSAPIFQEDGMFQDERYQNYLRYLKMSAANFEDQIRRDLGFQKVRDVFTQSLATTQLETDKKKIADNMKLNLEFVKFDSESIEKSYKVSAQELTKFQQNNAEKIKEYYEANKEDYKVKEQTKARHILIKAKSGDEKSFALALGKIKKISERLKKEDFAKVATELSEDPGSKIKGGDLGYFERGRMVKAFEQAAFSSPIGEVTEPIKTNYGYHLIKVEDRKSGDYKSLDKVSSEVARKLYIKDISANKIKDFKAAVASKDVNKINTGLSTLGLKWQETGEFSLSSNFIPKLGENKKLYTEALKLNKGEISPLIESDGQNYLVKMKSLAEKKSTINIAGGDYFQKFMAFQKVQGTLQKWIDIERKDSKIKTNLQFFQ